MFALAVNTFNSFFFDGFDINCTTRTPRRLFYSYTRPCCVLCCCVYGSYIYTRWWKCPFIFKPPRQWWLYPLDKFLLLSLFVLVSNVSSQPALSCIPAPCFIPSAAKRNRTENKKINRKIYKKKKRREILYAARVQCDKTRTEWTIRHATQTPRWISHNEKIIFYIYFAVKKIFKKYFFYRAKRDWGLPIDNKTQKDKRRTWWLLSYILGWFF